MKKLFLIMLLAPAIAFAQKAPKPGTGKILSLYQEGKYKEAKEQADITVADPKLSVDGKAWYYRGLVYATLDTVKDETVNSLDPNPLNVAIESFKKAEELNKKKDNEFFTMPKNSFTPITKTQQIEILANYYLDKSIKLLQQDEPDYEGSYSNGLKTAHLIEGANIKYGNDTLTYYVLSLSAFYAHRYDSAIQVSNKFIEKGGKGSDVYLILFQIYSERKDTDNALKVVKEGRQKNPFSMDLAKNELSVYFNTKQYDAAKALVEELLIQDQSADNYFLLGELNNELKKPIEAEAAFKKALAIDINHFNTNASMADMTYAQVRDTRADRDNTKDAAKRQQLYLKIAEQLKISLPYWERLETLKPQDETILYGLQSIYNDLSVYDEAKYTPKLNKLKAKMKALGMEVD